MNITAMKVRDKYTTWGHWGMQKQYRSSRALAPRKRIATGPLIVLSIATKAALHRDWRSQANYLL